MVQTSYALKSKADNNSSVDSIESNFKYFLSKAKEMPKEATTEQLKILDIVNEILKFNEKNQQ